MTDLVLGFLLGLGLGAVGAALVGIYCYGLGGRNEVLRSLRRLAYQTREPRVTRPISQQQWEAYQARESGMTRPAPPQKPSAPIASDSTGG